MRMSIRALLLLAAGVVVGVLAAASVAAPATKVAFVVDQQISGAGTVLVSSIPGCPTGTVTSDSAGFVHGAIGHFVGTHTIDCGDGNTFTLSYIAHARIGSPTDSGTWKIVAGTGAYADMKGNGTIAGTYYLDFTGILDNYAGTIQLAES
jgi:hypothetical protein